MRGCSGLFVRLETGAGDSAEIVVADIGRVVLSPNSQLELKVTGTDEHRMHLERGKIYALNRLIKDRDKTKAIKERLKRSPRTFSFEFGITQGPTTPREARL